MDIKGSAVLFSEMTPPKRGEWAFNRWHDGHHTPSHVDGVPGFLSAMRYKSKAGPHYAAVFELTSPQALDCDEYRSRELTPDDATRDMLQSVSGSTRYIGAEAFLSAQDGDAVKALDAKVLFCAFFKVPMERTGAFEDWFDTDHAPALMENKKWLMVRRFEVVEHDPDPFSHMVLHYLKNERVLNTETLNRANGSERTRELAAEPWFTPQYVTYHKRRKRFLKP